MITIAICDDKKPTIENLDALLQTYAGEKSLDIKVQYFSTPSALYNYMHLETVDIVFMDLNFGTEQEDGILWATRLHNHFPQTLVIILTAYKDRYKEGYVAKAFRFMTKPFSQEELYENMNACMEEFNLYKALLLVRDGNTQKIPIQDILYFGAHAGGSELKTLYNSYFCEESLLQWEEKVAPNIFFRCHKKISGQFRCGGAGKEPHYFSKKWRSYSCIKKKMDALKIRLYQIRYYDEREALGSNCYLKLPFHRNIEFDIGGF